MHHSLLARLKSAGPKRILSLDGGGIRGSAAIGFLERLEATVRDRLGQQATLSDYFDLIGGTSTGAIIASQLALGTPVELVKQRYFELGPKVFSSRTWASRVPWIGPRLFTQWGVKPLEEEAKRLLREQTVLGSPALKTGLCIVAKRADTFSTWHYINHPEGRFYSEIADVPLWKLVRASSAAPTYFKPMRVDVGGQEAPDFGVFIDGGVSRANNPALELFLIATLKGFPFRWRTGDAQLLMVSVGTGRFRRRLSDRDVMKSNNLFWARNVPELLMEDASEQAEAMLQYLSDSPTARDIDWQSGKLEGDLLGGSAHLHYVRYNSVLDIEPLRAVGIETTPKELQSLRDMSVGSNAQRLYEIGAAFASHQFSASHLPALFNPPAAKASAAAAQA